MLKFTGLDSTIPLYVVVGKNLGKRRGKMDIVISVNIAILSAIVAVACGAVCNRLDSIHQAINRLALVKKYEETGKKTCKCSNDSVES